jgi:hypothetical protein
MSQGTDLIHNNDLYFDGGDKANGSLYLCAPLGSDAAPVAAAIERLRAAGLWSSDPRKQVAEAAKPVYAEQMVFVEQFSFTSAGIPLVAARYDHPKFPSSAERFSAWRDVLGA